jgi:phosphoribosylamine--glycine ligase
MKILVAGGGGREHALAWALCRDHPHRVLVCPGNPGTAAFAENIPGDPLQVALGNRVDLVVVGPEAPLAAGLGDRLRASGIPCFGPGADCARLESSKWFAKEVMTAAGVPTARGRVFDRIEEAFAHMEGRPMNWVIKSDGLAAGKGVILPTDITEARNGLESLFAMPPGRVVVEERLSGPEVSVMAVCSGTEAVMLPPSRDHKRLGDGDTGPNTGGMGAICPPPGLEAGFIEDMRLTVFQPVLLELRRRGLDYRGVLYAGMILSPDGPRVLEFNVRFGDPETQSVLPMLAGDLAELCMAAAVGTGLRDIETRKGASATVVLASAGYPGVYGKGAPITGLERVRGALVFHAGTAMAGGLPVTAGGRVLGVTALGSSLDEAVARSYEAVSEIAFEGMYYRRDIGRKP